MIQAIAIDDEPKALQVIKHHIEKMDGIVLIDFFHGAGEALLFLKENPVDLIFLDINMPHQSGLDMLDKLHFRPQIIFTTAYSQYAVESYEYQAADYLLKPFDFDRLQRAVQKAGQRIAYSRSDRQYVFLKDGAKTIKLKINDILFVKGSGNYLDIVTGSKTHSPRLTFAGFFDKVPIDRFCRIHQSYIVQIPLIDKIEKNYVFIGAHKVPISQKYKDSFIKRIGLE